MPERAVRRRLVRMLGSLPLLADFARRLGIQATVEKECPSRGNAHLTHAQVALTVIANRLTQPKAMYHLLAWAKKWAVRETFGVDPERLNDDRIGRCLDALAEKIDPIQGAVTVAAVREFDLDLSQLHWDLTSVVLQGAYPPEEQDPEHPQPRYGFGGEDGCKQLRVGELVTADGAVPVWHETLDGNRPDVGTVVAMLAAVKKEVPLPECLVIGDSKLLSAEVIRKLRDQHQHFLAPLPSAAELDREFLALSPSGWAPLDYVAQRQEKLPPEERTQYQGQEVAWEWTHPKTAKKQVFRRLYVLSSEERETCRKVRGQQLVRAATELNQLLARVGKGRLKTREQVAARVEKVLTERRAQPFFRVTLTEAAGQLLLEWALDAEAIAAAERRDGYYCLLTSWPKEKADASTLLRRWKGEWQVERRFADWKGPLQVRPVFVTSNRRLAALVLLLHLALMLFCLLEREARRALARVGQEKVRRLLAGHVDAVPTGANILQAFEHLFLFIEEEEHGREYHVSEMLPEQEDLWKLLRCRMPAWC